MLRLWLGPTIDYAIDINFLSFYIDHGENYEIALDLAGNAHITTFSDTAYPIRSFILIPTNQFTLKDSFGNDLRSRLNLFIESGTALTIFESTSNKAYKLSALKLKPGTIGGDEFPEKVSATPIELDGIVVADGIFTDIDSIASVSWKVRS